MVGNSAVGKSCLVLQFERGEAPQEHDTTIGVEFGTKICTINKENVKIQIWDTAGQENFRSLIRSYYRSAIGAIIVYDFTRRSTFYDLQRWIEDIKENGNPSVVIMLCGNKADLEDKREVSTEEGQNLANLNNTLFMETSAKTGQNVEQAFMNLANEVYERIQDGKIIIGKHEPGVKTGSQYKTNSAQNDQPNEVNLQQIKESNSEKKKDGCC